MMSSFLRMRVRPELFLSEFAEDGFVGGFGFASAVEQEGVIYAVPGK